METSPPSLPPTTTNWRLFLELLSFAFFILPVAGNIIGPLILWLVKKDSDAIANEDGKKVLNFNISWTLWSMLSCGVGFVVWFVIALIATIKAANNEPFKHPLTIRFLK